MKYLITILLISLIFNASWAEETVNQADPNLANNTSREKPGPVLEDTAPTGAENGCCADKASSVSITGKSNPGQTANGSGKSEGTTGRPEGTTK